MILWREADSTRLCDECRETGKEVFLLHTTTGASVALCRAHACDLETLLKMVKHYGLTRAAL